MPANKSKPRHQYYTQKKTCVICQAEFMSARDHTKTCSQKCRKALSRQDSDYIEPCKKKTQINEA